MVSNENMGFSLPRGATGFYRPKDGHLPETDLGAFRGALYAAARAAGGKVGEVEKQAYPRTFHTASVRDGAEEPIILCHVYHPWIAFVQRLGDWQSEEFVAPPPWASSFEHAGFVALARRQLATGLTDLDTSGLSQSEWREIRYSGVTTLGGVIFNAWD
ncbi:hypothetical protein PV341_42215 [Streptomyces sp. PA03-1a]|nr:hypothetical protein [Streptomyces sp. PA03-1a]